MSRARLPVKGARGPSQGKAVAQARWDNHAIQPRIGLSSANPTSHQSEGRKGIELSLKEHLKCLGKAVLTAIQYSAPDRAEFYGFYNHPQRLWVWTDGTSINFGKFKPTRGRRTASTG